MGSGKHMLTDIDLTARTATCAQCGPRVRIYGAGPGRVACSARLHKAKGKPSAVRSNRESSWRRRGINLTVEQYDAMVEAQAGLCPGCSNGLGDRPHVDHDHATGRIRGVLCRNCNRVLGLLADDPARLRALADYLGERE